MIQGRRKEFLSKARAELKKIFISIGVVLLDEEEFDDELIKIGKEYYKLEKEEEL